jgi:hypothetical protein
LIPAFSLLPRLVIPGDFAIAVAQFIGVAFVVYSMGWSPDVQGGSPPFFNAISMAFGVYLSSHFPHLEPDATLPIVASLWALVMAGFGIAPGMLTVTAQLPPSSR